MRRRLKEWGLVYGALSEKDVRRLSLTVLEKRLQYLEELAKSDRDGYQRVYIDESYVVENHAIIKGWHDPSFESIIHTKSGNGRRIAVIGAITE